MKIIADLSHWNKVADWNKVKDSVEHVIYKATQGTKYVDPTYLQAKERCKARGIKFSSYHFADGGDPAIEARHFYRIVSTADALDGELILDWEISHKNPVVWCATFLKELEYLSGKKGWIYLNNSTVGKYDWSIVKDYPLWVARYGMNTGSVPTLYKPNAGVWGNYTLWQYTSRGRVPGIEGNVDLNLPSMTPDADYSSEMYYQRSKRYSGHFLGLSKTSMQQYGCALMCFSRIAGKDPFEVNQLFIEKGVYSGDMIDFGKACKALGFTDYEKNYDINRMPTQKLTIKEVWLGKGQHFVVRINDKGRSIFDPWTNKILPINEYKFRSYRIFNS